MEAVGDALAYSDPDRADELAALYRLRFDDPSAADEWARKAAVERARRAAGFAPIDHPGELRLRERLIDPRAARDRGPGVQVDPEAVVRALEEENFEELLNQHLTGLALVDPLWTRDLLLNHPELSGPQRRWGPRDMGGPLSMIAGRGYIAAACEVVESVDDPVFRGWMAFNLALVIGAVESAPRDNFPNERE